MRSGEGNGVEAFRAASELNFLSTVALVQSVVGGMRANGWGRVLAITSVGARQPIPSLAASTSARAATTAFIKNLATEVAGDGVTANTIQPGSHRTARMAQLRGEIFERGVIACFKGLAWDYKTNLPQKFGKRIVMTYLTGWHSYERANQLDDLMRVLSILDGKIDSDVAVPESERNGVHH